MEVKLAWMQHSLLFCCLTLPLLANAALPQDPCDGPAALLNIIDRPTNGDSACVVPFKKAVLEAGYEYQSLSHSRGKAYNLPEAELRIGLPANNEFVVIVPNYIHQSSAPHNGSAATVVGIKHEMGYTQHWLGAVETLVTLPTGSSAFGSHGTGVALNGIIAYAFNEKFSIDFMLGATTQTTSTSGQRFTSINPDLIATYVPIETMNIFIEVYGQSKTSPSQGYGFNADTGIIYLLHPKLAVDAEVGQRINGNFQGFDHYVGVGLSTLFF